MCSDKGAMSALHLLLLLSISFFKECNTSSAVWFDDRCNSQTQCKKDVPNFSNSDTFYLSYPNFSCEDSYIENTMPFPRKIQSNAGTFSRTNLTPDSSGALSPVSENIQLSGRTSTLHQQNYEQFGSKDKWDILEITVPTQQTERNQQSLENNYFTKSSFYSQKPYKTTSCEIRDAALEEENLSLTRASPCKKTYFESDDWIPKSFQNIDMVPVDTKSTSRYIQEEKVHESIRSQTRYPLEDCFEDLRVKPNSNNMRSLNRYNPFDIHEDNAVQEESQAVNLPKCVTNSFPLKDSTCLNEKIRSPSGITVANNFPQENPIFKSNENYLSTLKITSSIENDSKNEDVNLLSPTICRTFQDVFTLEESNVSEINKIFSDLLTCKDFTCPIENLFNSNKERGDCSNPYTCTSSLCCPREDVIDTNKRESACPKAASLSTIKHPQNEASGNKLENYPSTPIPTSDHNIFQGKERFNSNVKGNIRTNDFSASSTHKISNNDLHTFTSIFSAEEISKNKQNKLSTFKPPDISFYEKSVNTNEKEKDFQVTGTNISPPEASTKNKQGSRFTNIDITEDVDCTNRVSDQFFIHTFTDVSSPEKLFSENQKTIDSPVPFTHTYNSPEKVNTYSNEELNISSNTKYNTEDIDLSQTEKNNQHEMVESALLDFLASNSYSSVPIYEKPPHDGIGPYVFSDCENKYFLYSRIFYNDDGQPINYENCIATICEYESNLPEIFNSPCIRSCIQKLIPSENRECLELIDNNGKISKYGIQESDTDQNTDDFWQEILDQIENCNEYIQLSNGKIVKIGQTFEILRSITNTDETILTVPHLFSGKFVDLCHVLKNFPTNLAKNAIVCTSNNLVVPFFDYCDIIALCGTYEMFKSTPYVEFNGNNIDCSLIACIIASETNKQDTAAIMPNKYVIPFSTYSKYIQGLAPEEKEAVGIVSQYMDKPVSYKFYEDVAQTFINSNNELPITKNPNVYLWKTGTEVPLCDFLAVFKFYNQIPSLVLELPDKKYINLEDIVPVLAGMNLEYIKNCVVHFPNSENKVNLLTFNEICKTFLEH